MSIQSTPNSSPPTNHAGSYITFACADTHFALNVDSVKYITSIDAINIQQTPLENGVMNRIFSFADRPVVLYSFHEIVGSYSQVEENKNLIKSFAEYRQYHFDWMQDLEKSIKTGISFNQATEPLMCEFGKWYEHYKSPDEELSNILEKFDAPHKHMHSLAETLLTLAKKPENTDEALQILEKEKHTTLHTLLNLFTIAETRLNDMVKQVIIVLETQGKVFAIDLDNIEQLEEFQETHWLKDHSHTEQEQPCYDGYFQKESGDLYININPSMLIQ
ncbi:MAG: CZB domain-containing protein [Saccharospirillaceae bacterium]|nr:CZB domain-containing protein [Pseudomonadales bacterium]NRB80744.1 CZB domain-containing protein [Saccharospirillaceae bacterium]